MQADIKELISFAERILNFIPQLAPNSKCQAHDHANSQWAIPDSQDVSSIEQTLDSLILELFELQFRYNEVYRRYCQWLGTTPDKIKSWQEIPAVPTSAFREFDVTCLPPSLRECVFLSSGTTSSTRSRHYHFPVSLKLYECSITHWFFAHVWPDVLESKTQHTSPSLCILTPSPACAPESSLVYMLKVIAGTLKNVHFFGAKNDRGQWIIDCAAATKMLMESVTPVIILAPAYALVILAEYLRQNSICLQLHPQSVIMETGGYKNMVRAIPKPEFYQLLQKTFGLPIDRIISEYGMCELGSQAYDHAVEPMPRSEQHPTHSGADISGRFFHFPPWVRVSIISPETGQEVQTREVGIIKVIDLANVFSVQAILTGDLAVKHPKGFQLIGRITALESRGCSLMVTNQ